MLKAVLAGAIALGFAMPAFAQVDSFYVVQDTKTKKCTIVNKKPMATEYTVVGGDGVVYKTHVEAESAMKTVKVCHTE